MNLKNNDYQSILQKLKVVFWKRPLFFIILFSVIFRLAYLLFNLPLWWDSHVYIGMAKYIFSAGQLGIWEIFRPLLHSIILGLFWKIGLNVIIIGKLLDILFSVLAIYLTYKIGKEIFNEKIALLGTILFSFNSLFLMFNGLILTEPLAIFLGLMGTFLFIKISKNKSAEISTDISTNKKKEYLLLLFSGLFLGLSFMSKFPMGIIFAAAGISLLFKRTNLFNKIREGLILLFGFLIPVIPYLIFNHYKYQNILLPFTEGSQIVTTATWAYGSGILYYFIHFFLAYPLFLFFFVYCYEFIKNKHWKDYRKLILLLIPLLVLIYFIYVPRKEIRYLVLIIPFISILSAYSIIKTYHYLKNHAQPLIWPKAFIIICTIAIIVYFLPVFGFENIPTMQKEVQETIQNYNIKGTILSSDPSLVSYVDNPLTILSAGMWYGPQIYEQNKHNYDLLFINDCDFICAPEDNQCVKEREGFFNIIIAENKALASSEYKNCTKTIYLPLKQSIIN